MSNPIPLLPCPFCGEPAHIEESSIGFRVSCIRCDMGTIHNNWTLEGCVELWNSRKPALETSMTA